MTSFIGGYGVMLSNFGPTDARTLWVCHSADQCMKRRRALGNPDGIRFMPVGMSIVGFGFDLIILDDVYAGMSPDLDGFPTLADMIKDIRCRLSVGGRIAVMSYEGEKT